MPGIDEDEVSETLDELGLIQINIDIVEQARSRVGISSFKRDARLNDAPEYVNCSGFIRWIYAQRGIWLPRRAIQQREVGGIVFLDNLQKGDLVFTTGRLNRYVDDPSDGVGHVSMVTENNTLIMAANEMVGIREYALDNFLSGRGFRGARRIIPKDHDVVTLLIPEMLEVETSDDVRWFIIDTLQKTVKHKERVAELIPG